MTNSSGLVTGAGPIPETSSMVSTISSIFSRLLVSSEPMSKTSISSVMTSISLGLLLTTVAVPTEVLTSMGTPQPSTAQTMWTSHDFHCSTGTRRHAGLVMVSSSRPSHKL